MEKDLEQIEVTGTHEEIGLAIGRRFRENIVTAFEAVGGMLGRYERDTHSPAGHRRYHELLGIHRKRFPDYVAECEGIAQGAGIPFRQVFLMNLRGEYRVFSQTSDLEGCSDCSLLSEEVAAFGHNEDGNPELLKRSYLVHASIPGKPALVAFSYPGFLCGNAFGFNEEGICFSVDDVRPNDVRIGYGRHFLARSLFEARSTQDAIERVTIARRASGFSYTIGSVHERRIVQVEVSPRRHHVREIEGFNFHANHYLDLDVAEATHPSSRARVDRSELLRQSGSRWGSTDILSILGDEEDPTYPIYRQAKAPDRSVTHCSAIFDLDGRTLRIFLGNPARAQTEDICLVI
jgi:predicted choloylglycine hydrolase